MEISGIVSGCNFLVDLSALEATKNNELTSDYAMDGKVLGLPMTAGYEYVMSASSMTNFPKEKDPILAEADNAQPDKELVMYDGGGDDFQAIQNETAFDYKKLGAEMFTDGFDLKARQDELNAKWKAAKGWNER